MCSGHLATEAICQRAPACILRAFFSEAHCEDCPSNNLCNTITFPTPTQRHQPMYSPSLVVLRHSLRNRPKQEIEIYVVKRDTNIRAQQPSEWTLLCKCALEKWTAHGCRGIHTPYCMHRRERLVIVPAIGKTNYGLTCIKDGSGQ